MHQHICSKGQSRTLVSLMNDFETSGQKNASVIKKNPVLPMGSI